VRLRTSSLVPGAALGLAAGAVGLLALYLTAASAVELRCARASAECRLIEHRRSGDTERRLPLGEVRGTRLDSDKVEGMRLALDTAGGEIALGPYTEEPHIAREYDAAAAELAAFLADPTRPAMSIVLSRRPGRTLAAAGGCLFGVLLMALAYRKSTAIIDRRAGTLTVDRFALLRRRRGRWPLADVTDLRVEVGKGRVVTAIAEVDGRAIELLARVADDEDPRVPPKDPQATEVVRRARALLGWPPP
jgi:hypothetical protein